MTKSRLEAFSDGVIAILITIMILELKAPKGTGWDALDPVIPGLLAYVLSFVNLGIYWANHHHMLHMTDRINGRILWANLHLLFWLSLIPFATSWLAEEHNATVPTVVYGGILFLAGLAYTVLSNSIIKAQGPDSKLKAAIGADLKGRASVGVYALAIALAFVAPWVADVLIALVALMWLVPDSRIESRFT